MGKRPHSAGTCSEARRPIPPAERRQPDRASAAANASGYAGLELRSVSLKERTLLARTSVFVDGWTLEAAETVCAGDGIDQPDVLNLLGSLSTKSLLIADVRTSETRYRLLETVQQYAWDRLIESGSAADARRRHRDCYLALAERRAPEHPTKGYKWMVRPEWLDLLEREHGNLRAALQ